MAIERPLPVLWVAVRPSRILTWLIGCGHAMAAGAVLAALPQAHLRVLAGLALLASALRAIARHALLRDRHAVAALELHGEAGCTLVQRDGTRAAAQVLGSSYVTRALTVLHLRQESRRRLRYVVLMSDSAAPETLRRLRVRLRWRDESSASRRDEVSPL
jgi:hypothetical protein